ncbi:hypothetical protein HK103_001351 [Boothiomyces macroporosus]|uniref:Uncharacterized protein n=1 Tax=Boothiomyces macroporosus TaxID=261099 RepID=A0AAD5UAP2_9FUNG|nr:hypothetical protein HK103_001351 [Boothiomyces macroporosus]
MDCTRFVVADLEQFTMNLYMMSLLRQHINHFLHPIIRIHSNLFQPGVGYGGVAAGVGAGVLAGIALDQAFNHHDHNAVHTQQVTVDHGYYGDQVHTTTYDDDGYGNVTAVDQDDF